MGFRINTNVAALSAHANASMNNRAIDNSLSKLNSGFRINSAADDASGMAIADSLRSQASSLGKAIMNANDAIGIIQTADKAMDEQIKILDTIKQKAIQSAQDGQTTETRRALQADISRLMEELDNIGNTTSFNGQKLLSGTFSNKEFQIGAYSNETVKASIGATTSDKIGLTRFETGHNVRASDITGKDNANPSDGRLSITFKNVDGINDITLEPVQIANITKGEKKADGTFEKPNIEIKAGQGLGALAEAINKASDKTGVRASVTTESVFSQTIKAGTTGEDFSINGVRIGKIEVKDKDANGALRAAINSVKDQTGVEASVDSKGRLVLNNRDGRGIQVSDEVDISRKIDKEAVKTALAEANTAADTAARNLNGKSAADTLAFGGNKAAGDAVTGTLPATNGTGVIDFSSAATWGTNGLLSGKAAAAAVPDVSYSVTADNVNSYTDIKNQLDADATINTQLQADGKANALKQLNALANDDSKNMNFTLNAGFHGKAGNADDIAKDSGIAAALKKLNESKDLVSADKAVDELAKALQAFKATQVNVAGATTQFNGTGPVSGTTKLLSDGAATANTTTAGALADAQTKVGNALRADALMETVKGWKEGIKAARGDVTPSTDINLATGVVDGQQQTPPVAGGEDVSVSTVWTDGAGGAGTGLVAANSFNTVTAGLEAGKVNAKITFDAKEKMLGEIEAAGTGKLDISGIRFGGAFHGAIESNLFNTNNAINNALADFQGSTSIGDALDNLGKLKEAVTKFMDENKTAGGGALDNVNAQAALKAHAALQDIKGWEDALKNPPIKGMMDIVGLNTENNTNFGRLSLVANNGKDIQVEVRDGNGVDMTSAVGYDKGVSEKTVSLRETNAKIDKATADAMGFNSEEWMATEKGDNQNGYAAGVMTLKGAQAMMNIAETAQKALEAIRSDLGSVQNQLVSTVNNISVTQVNVKAAESNIRDVDFAEESATFSKHQILAQSGVYAMSQANAVQQNVMRLLQ